jgi:hypothetical protein
MQTRGGLPARSGGFLKTVKGAEVMSHTSDGDIRDIASCPDLQRKDALNSRQIISAAPSVHLILGCRCGAQVGNSVVQWVAINVVDDIRHCLSVDEQPSKPMQSIDNPVDGCALIIVAASVSTPHRLAGVSAAPAFVFIVSPEVMLRPVSPYESACCWIVIQAFAHISRVWQYLRSHSDLHTGLVVRDGVVLNSPRRSDCSMEAV